MAKVFTITAGLENMGALKTGGQGSVYKGRRIGEIITAIKLLPTPIYTESDDDKNYRDFKNEVQKLYKVNEVPNPNVVKILSAGLSETGNFPYIEMDFIEGPDLEELLKPPHEPVFTIKEAIKVAEQLSHALAHCHRVNVRHGDIKSNNVKYNSKTGNYVLLDFGLAVMSDEQRRTSLRQAGAIEFMAPEQNEGQLLFESDVYSFGVVLYELLAGQVPFPLNDKGETARNMVRLSHLETLPPDMSTLRSAALPQSWPPEKRERELSVPGWLMTMVDKCLEKRPENRFKTGMELHDFIVYEMAHAARAPLSAVSGDSSAQVEQLQREKDKYYQQLVQYRQQLAQKDKEIFQLRSLANAQEQGPIAPIGQAQKTTGVSSTAFMLLLLLTVVLAGYSAYTFLSTPRQITASNSADTLNTEDQPIDTTPQATITPQKPAAEKPKPIIKVDTVVAKPPVTVPDQPSDQIDVDTTTPSQSTTPVETPDAQEPKKFKVVVKAYFYSSPDETTQRKAYMVPADNAILTAQDEQNGFVYVVFTNQNGATSKGWLSKKDLKRVRE